MEKNLNTYITFQLIHDNKKFPLIWDSNTINICALQRLALLLNRNLKLFDLFLYKKDAFKMRWQDIHWIATINGWNDTMQQVFNCWLRA